MVPKQQLRNSYKLLVMKYTNTFFLVSSLLFLTACFKGEKVDLIIHNAKIHTLNNSNEIEQAIAIQDGKIVEVGPERQILNKYSAKTEIDALGKDITPGLYDLNVDLFKAATSKLQLDLSHTSSIEELYVRLEKYNQKHNYTTLVAKNLDLSLFKDKNIQISNFFPEKNLIIFLAHQDSVLINSHLAKQIRTNLINKKLHKEAISQFLPSYPQTEIEKNVKNTIHSFLQYGIIGFQSKMNKNQVKILESIINKETFAIDINCLLTWDLKHQKLFNSHKNKTLKIRGFHSNTHNKQTYQKVIEFYENHPKTQFYYELKTQSDINLFKEFIKEINSINPDHRWKVYTDSLNESFIDLFEQNSLFYNLLLHKSTFEKATTENLKNQLTLITLQSAFPFTDFFPHERIYSGLIHELELDEILALYSKTASMYLGIENTNGTLEKGKDATFVIFSQPLSIISEGKPVYAYKTFIKGKEVYSAE